jgi:hypothetical protein
MVVHLLPCGVFVFGGVIVPGCPAKITIRNRSTRMHVANHVQRQTLMPGLPKFKELGLDCCGLCPELGLVRDEPGGLLNPDRFDKLSDRIGFERRKPPESPSPIPRIRFPVPGLCPLLADEFPFS